MSPEGAAQTDRDDAPSGVLEREKTKLVRHFRRIDIFFFLLCTLIGLDTLGSVAAKGAEGFVWLIVLAISFFVPYALLIAELGSSFPDEGGAYVWTREAFGRPVASVNAVFYWLSNPIWLGGSLTITAVATWNTFFFDLGSVAKYVFGLAFIWAGVLAAILSFGIGKWVSTIGAIARVVLLAFFTLSVGLYAAKHGVHGIRFGDLSPSYDGFVALVPILFFNYVGFELPSSAGDEMVDARRDVPFAVIRSALTAIVAYAVPVFAILFVLPANRITGLKGFVDTMQTVFTVYGGSVREGAAGTTVVVLDGAGKVLGDIAALGFIWALVTSGTTWIMGADRTQAVACLDGGGPRRLGALSSRFGTPVPVNLASGLVATIVMVAAFAVSGGDADKYFTASLGVGISTTTISYLAVFPALYRLRRTRPDVPRPYSVPGGERGALLLSALTTGWALVATVSLVWPGFGMRGEWDAALPAPFVTLDAAGRVLSSERALFEVSQLVPLVIVLGLGLAFYAVGRRERGAALGLNPTVGRATAGAPPSAIDARDEPLGEPIASIAPASL